MAAHGTISECSSAQETWTSYIECLEQYLAANKVEAGSNITHCVWLSNLRGCLQFGIPQEANRAKFKDIVDLVTGSDDPKPSVVIQRYRFSTRNSRGGESISRYVAELLHLSEHCNFGTSLNEMLCDRIVCGIEDQKIQQRLLAEPDLTFDKAFELAL